MRSKVSLFVSQQDLFILLPLKHLNLLILQCHPYSKTHLRISNLNAKFSSREGTSTPSQFTKIFPKHLLLQSKSPSFYARQSFHTDHPHLHTPSQCIGLKGFRSKTPLCTAQYSYGFINLTYSIDAKILTSFKAFSFSLVDSFWRKTYTVRIHAFKLSNLPFSGRRCFHRLFF